MNPLVGAALIGAAGSVFSARTAAAGAKQQNQAAQASSREQMAFQERMSNSAYQRATEDMRKAGINPILAYQQGGASSPAGSQYSPVNVGLAQAQGLQAGASSANQLASSRFTQVKTGIEARTLKMLQKEKITMPEIQYTAKNIFSSKMLRTFEASLNGQYQNLPDPYKAVAIFMRGKFRDAGLVSGSGKVTAYNINPTKIGNVFKETAAFAGSIGLDITTEAGKSILESLGVFND
jgi:hypothetical protein